MSDPIFLRWREVYGGVDVDDAKGLRELGAVDTTLERRLAHSEVEKAALKETAV